MKRTQKYLQDLAHHLSTLSGPQALRAYFDHDKDQFLRTLRAHQSAGLISISTELVRSRISDKAIVVIDQGDALPSAHQVAYAAHQRWSSEILPTLTIRGTAKLAALYGGEVHRCVAGHVSHEVALADIFLAKREINPDFAWTLVRSAPGAGARPDALSAGTAIELIGRYNGATIAAKFVLAATWKLELW